MLKYLGGGYIPGVPERDLTDDEEKEYGALIEAEEQASGFKLYGKPAPKPTRKDAPAGDKE